MNDIWLVVRKDGADMPTTGYSQRTIRAYKTESMARSQAKRWNKGNKRLIPGTGLWSGGAYGCGQWIAPQYEAVEQEMLMFIVVKYVPAEES